MKHLRHFLLAAMLGATVAVAGTASVVAQEAEATPEWRSFPAGVHAGTCEAPEAEAAFDLGVTRAPGDDGDGVPAPQRGAAPGTLVTVIDTNIDTGFGELLDGPPHVIAVHESTEAFGTVVACGEIGGPEEGGRLAVGLRPINQSGVVGVAVLDADRGGFLGLGGEKVNVRIYVFELAPAVGEVPPVIPATPVVPATPVPPMATPVPVVATPVPAV